MFRYISTKTYDHSSGFSCCFRQHAATHSHCSFLHGYALAFRFEFGANDLDARNWVVDFGNLGALKEVLRHWFDHTTVVAMDDPHLETIRALGDARLAKVRILQRVGCESFAEFAYNLARSVIAELGMEHRVHVISCEVSEHGANSAIYVAPPRSK